MTKNPSEMSFAELEEYIDELTARGEDERCTPAWERAFRTWERREKGQW